MKSTPLVRFRCVLCRYATWVAPPRNEVKPPKIIDIRTAKKPVILEARWNPGPCPVCGASTIRGMTNVEFKRKWSRLSFWRKEYARHLANQHRMTLWAVLEESPPPRAAECQRILGVSLQDQKGVV